MHLVATVLYTPLNVYRSTIGKKAVMAVTGIVMYGYVVLHMLGNLKVFTGAEHFDAYAGFIRRAGDPVLGEEWFLWTARTILLAAVLLHIVVAAQLVQRNYGARPDRYSKTDIVTANYASRTMRWSGVIIGLFVVYHVLHLTTGTVHPEFHHGAVYDNVVAGFSVWYVSLAYIVAMVALGFHLFHGTWSMFQTLGRNRPGVDPLLRKFSAAMSILLVVGFISVPVGVMIGVVD